MSRAVDGDLDGLALEELEGEKLVCHVHLDLAGMVAQREAQPMPGRGQARVEAELAVEIPHTTESVCERHPHAARRCDMGAVDDVAGDIREVHQQPVLEVFQRLLLIADLGGQDGLHAGRQR